MFTAIFGGTFNPLHNGHYEMLKALNQDDRIEKILLMPDRIPPHKSVDALIDDKSRIEMCRIASEDFEKCEICLIEFERKGKSYTYDTVKLLQKKFPHTEFAFVCGGDMLIYFDKWWRYEELMKMLPFIVFRRTDTNEESFNASVEKFRNNGMNIILKDEKIPAVSSTELRNNFLLGEKLIPKKIYSFLSERGVYNGKI